MPIVASSSFLSGTGTRVGDVLILDIMSRLIPVVNKQSCRLLPHPAAGYRRVHPGRPRRPSQASEHPQPNDELLSERTFHIGGPRRGRIGQRGRLQAYRVERQGGSIERLSSPPFGWTRSSRRDGGPWWRSPWPSSCSRPRWDTSYTCCLSPTKAATKWDSSNPWGFRGDR